MIAIKCKNTDVAKNALSVGWDEMLIALYQWLSFNHPETILTSTYREGDRGVHGCIPLRGFDVRSWVFSDPEAICDIVNDKWIYDTDRPQKKVAMIHDVGKGKHFHFQVHPNTIYKGE